MRATVGSVMIKVPLEVMVWWIGKGQKGCVGGVYGVGEGEGC